VIYQPNVVLELRDVLETYSPVLTNVAFAVATDFIAGTNKPWQFYVGVAAGNIAAATGLPGAAATLYAIGDTVDALLLKSPEGGEYRIFLNGIAHSSITAYAGAAIWESVNIAGLVGGQRNRIDIVNVLNAGRSWAGVGPITVNGGTAELPGAPGVPYVAFGIMDNKGRKSTTTVYFYVSGGVLDLATLNRHVVELAQAIDGIIDGQIVSIRFGLGINVPGLKTTPQPSADVEEGIMLRMVTRQGNFRSMRIPTVTDPELGLLAGGRLDPDSPDAQRLEHVILNGVSGYYGGASYPNADYRGEQIVALTGAEHFQRSRR
jgi:hypothetical protein